MLGAAAGTTYPALQLNSNPASRSGSLPSMNILSPKASIHYLRHSIRSISTILYALALSVVISFRIAVCYPCSGFRCR